LQKQNPSKLAGSRRNYRSKSGRKKMAHALSPPQQSVSALHADAMDRSAKMI
jgi:hypothetical protein